MRMMIQVCVKEKFFRLDFHKHMFLVPLIDMFEHD